MSPRPAHVPEDPQSAGTRLPAGFELWVARTGPAADARLAASLAGRRPAAVVALAGGEAGGKELARAAGVEMRHGGARELHTELEHCREIGGGALVVVAADAGWSELLAAWLGMPAERAGALWLDEGRASCLVASSHGWLLSCHNVLDPGALERRDEGLGRPA